MTNLMNKKERFFHTIEHFKKAMPIAEPELRFKNPFQLLCAVMLSAQCTDKRVNLVTPSLFEKYPDAHSLSQADISDVKELIKSISYPNSKAEHLVKMAQAIDLNHNGEVPQEIDELMKLSGVGRKTANVVTSVLYNKPVIAVDTHVFRVSHRIGLSDGSTPEKVEAELEAHISEDLRPIAHHWLILHGRYICKSRAPRCRECALKEYCRFYESNSQTGF